MRPRLVNKAGYHQKFRLRHRTDLAESLLAYAGSDRAFVDSTAAARLTGLVAGFCKAAVVADELRRLGIPNGIVRVISE